MVSHPGKYIISLTACVFIFVCAARGDIKLNSKTNADE